MKKYTVSITGFEEVQEDNPLDAAKKVYNWIREDEPIVTVVDEQTKETFSVDLSEEDEDAVCLIQTDVKNLLVNFRNEIREKTKVGEYEELLTLIEKEIDKISNELPF
jgi:putative sterol carrier protein